MMCDIINLSTVAGCQTTQDIMLTVMNEPKRKRGRLRKKDVMLGQSSEPLHQLSPEMTLIEEYIPSSWTSHQVSILNTASVNLDHLQSSTS